MQGFGKFGFYEIFKDVYAGIVGTSGLWLIILHRTRESREV